MTERALELAEWTALKDFIEECREELAAGAESPACLKAMNVRIPPPPSVKLDVFNAMKRGLPSGHHVSNGTWRALQDETPKPALPFSLRRFILFAIILTAFVSLFLRNKTTWSRPLRRSIADQENGKLEAKLSDPRAVPDPEPAVPITTVRHPPPEIEQTLRRRQVRTHPIYRHGTLDEAIHAADLPEIRTRLKNGEDVNQHWPYLIYRLAISPKADDMAKRIEVARLCLDMGADVNSLKGWNGQSALLIAIHFGNVDVARLLIANGAMVNYSPPDSHLSALHRCVRLAATGSAPDTLAIMEMLFGHGANANQVDRLNETPLHKLLMDSWYARHDEATFEKLFPIALCLVEHGAHIMPESLKAKFITDNPLYEFVQAAIWERSKRLATGREFKRKWQLCTGMDDDGLIAEKVLQLR
ncbi:hypothetical protein N0V83_003841 [Neocucurbitaria cava]|uniref:Ankyrin repeat protein n=1 Tax=Neocucurbitaria cava TaxID=798079 RepID=A0A9W9CNH1_9PLEO|nr:hypothetical protein N0V83_003841 [Neocucurbitaria cava]